MKTMKVMKATKTMNTNKVIKKLKKKTLAGNKATKAMNTMKVMNTKSKQSMKSKKKSKVKGALYCRTSSPANADSDSLPRQQSSGQADADASNVELVQQISEVISGSLPKDKRVKFNTLMKEAPAKEIHKIFFELRALSRDADVGEDMYKDSVRTGVEFNCRDCPGVFVHNPSPVQQFLRRVILAMIELERNLIVTRLAAGREAAHKAAVQQVKIAKRQGKLKVGMLTQKGGAKSAGPSSFLAWYGEPTSHQKKQLKAVIKDRDDGVFGWRMLKEKINDIMGIELGSHETARRFAKECKLYFK